MHELIYSVRPETIGMRNFCFGLMISSTLSLVMAALFVRFVCRWGEKRRRRCINTHTHVENED